MCDYLQIQSVLDREHEIAKISLAAGNKERAMVALRQRKYQEGLLTKTYGQLENLEQLVSGYLTLILIPGLFPHSLYYRMLTALCVIGVYNRVLSG